MSPQTEDVRQIDGQTLPLNSAEGEQHPRKHWLDLAIALIGVAALLISGIWSRVRTRTTLSTEAAQVAITPVSVVSPERTSPAQEIVLPGNVQPFITSPIYS